MRTQYDNYEEYGKKVTLSTFELILGLVNLAVDVASAIAASSLAVWADALLALSSAINASLVLRIAHAIHKENGEKYNFGIERLEVLTSFVSDTIVCIGLLVLLVISVRQLFVPQETETKLLTFVLLKLFNILCNTYFVIQRTRLLKEDPSHLAETERATALEELVNEIVVGALTCVCYFLAEYHWVKYISPAASILICILFGFFACRRIRQVIRELSDVSLSSEKQDEIFNIVLDHRKNIKRVHYVNCHVLNSRIHVKINMDFEDGTTYREILQKKEELTDAIHVQYPDAVVSLVIE